MPIYEYRCGACGHEQDHLQKVSEKPLTKCPACSKKTYKKQLSAAGFQLKGSGWYATDFKTAGKKPAEKKADLKGGESKGGESKGAESKGDSKADTKAETKTETKKAAAAAGTD